MNVGDKKDPKVIDLFKEIRDKARTLAKHIDTVLGLAIGGFR